MPQVEAGGVKGETAAVQAKQLPSSSPPPPQLSCHPPGLSYLDLIDISVCVSDIDLIDISVYGSDLDLIDISVCISDLDLIDITYVFLTLTVMQVTPDESPTLPKAVGFDEARR